MQSELNQLNARNLALESQLNELLTSSLLSKDIIVSDIRMKQIYKIATRLASVTTSVMILGESGVGKDVYAKFIHSISNRKNRNFIHVNLGVIPKSLFESELFGYEAGAFTGASKTGKTGLIELADGGTLFLDEIGELALTYRQSSYRWSRSGAYGVSGRPGPCLWISASSPPPTAIWNRWLRTDNSVWIYITG